MELVNHVRSVFRLIEIAEEEIAAFTRQLPRDAFTRLCPPASMQRMTPDVYRSHVRERLQQLADGKLLATHAECVMMLSEMSLRSPLRREYTVAYWIAFQEVMPAEAVRSCAFDFTSADIEEGHQALADVRAALTRKIHLMAA